MKKSNSITLDINTVRLDKWLWAARFYKTRAVAKQAIESGKVRIDGQRVKVGRALKIGELLSIRRGDDLYQVEVVDLAEKRGPAEVAQRLYEESKDSISSRFQAAEVRRNQRMAMVQPGHRPDKRQRRNIHQFKQSIDRRET